jgi:hypothetical protein
LVPARAWLTYAGAITANNRLLWAHMALGAVAALWAIYHFRQHLLRYAAVPAVALLLAPLAPQPVKRNLNPKVVPVAMEEEGGGPRVPSGRVRPRPTWAARFPRTSSWIRSCGECHVDAYKQWDSSVHHFASFNNQYYRKSIEHMQELSGTRGSKWCASCHDHAVFFNGRFDKPIKDQIDTPEAQNGLGVLPLDYGGGRFDGQRRLHDRIRRCTSWRRAGTATSGRSITSSPILTRSPTAAPFRSRS